jgi:hypothetical protein
MVWVVSRFGNTRWQVPKREHDANALQSVRDGSVAGQVSGERSVRSDTRIAEEGFDRPVKASTHRHAVEETTPLLEVIKINEGSSERVTSAVAEDEARLKANSQGKSQEGSNVDAEKPPATSSFVNEWKNHHWRYVPERAKKREAYKRVGDGWSASDIENLKREHEAALDPSMRAREEKFDRLLDEVEKGRDWVSAAETTGLERWEIEEKRRIFKPFNQEFERATKIAEFNLKYRDTPWKHIDWLEADEHVGRLERLEGVIPGKARLEERIGREHDANLPSSVREREEQFDRYLSQVGEGHDWKAAASANGFDMRDIQEKRRTSEHFTIELEKAIKKNAPTEDNLETVEWYKNMQERFREEIMGQSSSDKRPYWDGPPSAPYFVDVRERNEAKREELKREGGVKNWILRKTRLYETY